MGVRSCECRVAAQSHWNRTALATCARLVRSRKGTRKGSRNTFKVSELMTKGSLALWDHDSK